MSKNSVVVVAMSGGVDSSTVAALMKKKYKKVIGVTLNLFESDSFVESIEDARCVADFLKIDHEIIDCRAEFKKNVIDYFRNSYACGITPNPCIICNQSVKFSFINEICEKLNADAIATGHYVIIDKNLDNIFLRKAIDLSKDQSYFLYRVPKAILNKCEFPLGILQKTQVRKIAEQLRIPVSKKADSQDICFIKNGKYSKFLNANSKGLIIDEKGDAIGFHNGICNYTIGQRKALGLSNGPFFVTKIIPNLNQIIVSKNPPRENKIILKDPVWINEKFSGECDVKVRSCRPSVRCEVKINNEYVEVYLKSEDTGLSPGQHCAFYNGDTVIGGGEIF